VEESWGEVKRRRVVEGVVLP